MEKRKNTISTIFIVCVSLLLCIYALAMLFLLYWGLLTSLKSRLDFLFKENMFGFPNMKLSKKEFFNIVPVRLDLFNPTAGYGLHNQERSSFFSRCQGVDCCIALALIHHLRVSGNWQITDIVKLFCGTGKNILVEFVPLEDEQMRQLIRGRETIYQDWTLENVVSHFAKEFSIIKTTKLPDSGRVLIELYGKK